MQGRAEVSDRVYANVKIGEGSAIIANKDGAKKPRDALWHPDLYENGPRRYALGDCEAARRGTHLGSLKQ